MIASESLIVGAYVFRIAVVAAGVVFAVLGYRLFVLGVVGPAGHLEAVWRENKILLKRAAPGTFFAFFGVFSIVAALFFHPRIREEAAPNPSEPSRSDNSASVALRGQTPRVIGYIEIVPPPSSPSDPGVSTLATAVSAPTPATAPQPSPTQSQMPDVVIRKKKT
jgi:hypothetical protein